MSKLWDAAKAVLRWKYIAVYAYIKREERSQINNVPLHLKKPKNKLNPKLEGNKV